MRNILALVLSLFLCAGASSAQTRKKVVITSRGFSYSQIREAELASFRAAAPNINLVVVDDKTKLMAEIADADGIIGTVNADILKAAKNLKWVQVHMAGVENVLTPEMKKSPAILTNCKIAQGPEIGDHAMALLLALTRDLNRIIQRRGREEWLKDDYHPIELLGKRAVIIGVGGLGTNIAVRAKAFGLHVTGLDVREVPPSPYVDEWYPPDRLDEVLPRADVVIVSAPSTAATLKMIGPKQFALMKKTAYLIVVSRGRLYDMDALVNALQTKQIAGAAVDVTDPAEPLPPGHPLWKFENVIVTPHIAGRSDGEHARYMAIFRENLRRFQNNEPLINVVDKEKGY